MKQGELLYGGEGNHIPSIQNLEKLHLQLSTNKMIQSEIDRYLLACYYDTKNPDMQLVLNSRDTFHYHNLPNLHVYLKNALSNGEWSNNIIASFMSIFVLQIKKQKKNYGQTKLIERTALINILHGLLLGLYPYNMKQIEFKHRVKIVGEIHQLFIHSSPLEFILENEALISFAMIEYLSNVVSDFWPVEFQYMVKTQFSRLNINQVCEVFRSSIETCLQDQNFWFSLNKSAAANLPSLYRQLKLNNYKLYKKLFVNKFHVKALKILSTDVFYENILNLPIINKNCANLIPQIKLLCPNMSFDELQCVESFWNNVRLSKLPQKYIEEQCNVVSLHGACSQYQSAISTMYVCFLCALKNGQNLFSQKFAYNCIDKEMICISCSKTAVRINMIGKMLSILNRNYYLCNMCLAPTVWDGIMFQCSKCRVSNVKQSCMSNCFFCHRKTFEITHKVINLEKLCIEDVPLCFAHTKTYITANSTIYDLESIQKEFGAKVNT